MSTKIKYRGETVTSIDGGQTATLHLKDKKLTDDLIIEADGMATPTTETKTVTPSKSVQKVTATNADYLSEVTVEAIPDEYEIPVYFNAETDIEVGESVKLISFTIDGTQYQAVEGMSWYDWVNDANYNTGGFGFTGTWGSLVHKSNDYYVYNITTNAWAGTGSTASGVTEETAIVPNQVYSLVYYAYSPGGGI
jgi:hypothetical protein